jgi:hypothetical protein
VDTKAAGTQLPMKATATRIITADPRELGIESHCDNRVV